MVNATIDNDPVFIQLGGGESTTVPTNEVWKVSIHLSNRGDGILAVNGVSGYKGRAGSASTQGNYLDIVLVGGTNLAETKNESTSNIIISGFVVKS